MAKIDKMLEMMRAREIERAVLLGDRAFQLFAAGRHVEGAHISSAQLKQLLGEITPHQFVTSLEEGGTFHFVYGSPFGFFDVGVENFVGTLQVTLRPAKPDALATSHATLNTIPSDPTASFNAFFGSPPDAGPMVSSSLSPPPSQHLR